MNQGYIIVRMAKKQFKDRMSRIHLTSYECNYLDYILSKYDNGFTDWANQEIIKLNKIMSKGL